MEMLPHLTLEQIDTIDLPRYMRAWEARELVQQATLEQKRPVDIPNWETPEEERTWRTLEGWLRGRVPVSEIATLDQTLVSKMMSKMGKQHG